MTNSLFSGRGWNTLYTLSLTSLHNKMQGSVVLRQVKAVPLFAFIKSKWPIITYYTESQASFSISRCSGLFFCVPLSGKKWLRTPSSHFLFLGHFHFIKLQSVCSVCAEEGRTRSLVVPPRPPLVTQVPSGLALCDHERTWRLVQLCQAADFFFFFPEWGMCGE